MIRPAVITHVPHPHTCTSISSTYVIRWGGGGGEILTTKAHSPDDDMELFGAGIGLVATSAEALGRFKI